MLASKLTAGYDRLPWGVCKGVVFLWHGKWYCGQSPWNWYLACSLPTSFSPPKSFECFDGSSTKYLYTFCFLKINNWETVEMTVECRRLLSVPYICWWSLGTAILRANFRCVQPTGMLRSIGPCFLRIKRLFEFKHFTAKPKASEAGRMCDCDLVYLPASDISMLPSKCYEMGFVSNTP